MYCMNIDFTGHIEAVRRSVTYLERDGQSASTVSLSRRFATSLEDLWDAVANAERIPRWFLPITGELELGGRYQLEGNAGGTITACEKLSHFSLTWEFAGWTSWVDVEVAGEGTAQASLSLTHMAHLSEHWDTYGPGAGGVGWEMGMLGLALHLEQPDKPMPDDAYFTTTPEGRTFIAASSEEWGQASIAAGTDPEAAKAAANRTTAFYTGETH